MEGRQSTRSENAGVTPLLASGLSLVCVTGRSGSKGNTGKYSGKPKGRETGEGGGSWWKIRNAGQESVSLISLMLTYIFMDQVFGTWDRYRFQGSRKGVNYSGNGINNIMINTAFRYYLRACVAVTGHEKTDS